MWSCVGVGAVLVFLGIVNSGLGHTKIVEYAQLLELLAESDPDLLEETGRRIDAAERKLAFYGTVERGGGWMAMTGAGLVLAGLAIGRPWQPGERSRSASSPPSREC